MLLCRRRMLSCNLTLCREIEYVSLVDFVFVLQKTSKDACVGDEDILRKDIKPISKYGVWTMLLRLLAFVLSFASMHQIDAMPKVNPLEVNVIKNAHIDNEYVCPEFQFNMPSLCINGGLKRYVESPLNMWRNMTPNLQKQCKDDFFKNISYSYKTDYGKSLGYFLSRITNDNAEVLLSDISNLYVLPNETKLMLTIGWNIMLITDVIKIDVIGIHSKHSKKIFVMDPLNPLSEALIDYTARRRKISCWSLHCLFGLEAGKIAAGDVLYFPIKCYRFHIK